MAADEIKRELSPNLIDEVWTALRPFILAGLIDLGRTLWFWVILLIGRGVTKLALQFGFSPGFVHVADQLDTFLAEVSILAFFAENFAAAMWGYIKRFGDLRR